MTEESRSVYAGTRITETLFTKLEELALREGISKSEIINNALEQYIIQRNSFIEVKKV